VNILVLSKHKPDTRVQFIDASGEEFFKKSTNTNLMTDRHVAKVLELFDRKEDVAHVAQSVRMERIAQNDYNLSVSSYVEAKDTRQLINIAELNQQIAATVRKIDGLRQDINAIVEEIEG
jgi:type I restriction enzyme M protein